MSEVILYPPQDYAAAKEIKAEITRLMMQLSSMDEGEYFGGPPPGSATFPFFFITIQPGVE